MKAKEKSWVGKLLVMSLVVALVLGMMLVYARSYGGNSSSNVIKELSVKITNPKDGETISGIVTIKAEVRSENKLKEVKYVIIKGKGPWILKEIEPRCEFTTSDGKHMYCEGELDSSEINIPYISIVAMVWDVNNNYAEDSIGAYIKKNVTKELGEECILYAFYGEGCPHCGTPWFNFLDDLQNKYPNLKVKIFEIYHNIENKKLFEEMLNQIGEDKRAVPCSIINNQAFFGFSTMVNNQIENAIIEACCGIGKQTKKKATLRVKAYDVETGEVVRDATTIVLKYSSEAMRKVPIEVIEEVRTEEEKEKNSGVKAEEMKRKKYVLEPKIVVGILKADSIDSIEIEPGTYDLITYAINYTLHTNYRIKIEAGKEYNLYAPLSKGKVIKIPKKKKNKPIIVKTREIG